MITLSHANCLLVTIQYPYEKLITLERFVVEFTKNLINVLLVGHTHGPWAMHGQQFKIY